MPDARHEPTRWDLLLARDALTDSARSALSQRAARGELVRLSRGAYLPRGAWEHLDDAARHRATIQAVAATTRDRLTFSHASAAALWRLPWWNSWPHRVDAVVAPPTSVTSTKWIRRHIEPARATVNIDGVRATSLARTVVDVARGPDLFKSIIVADAALNVDARKELGLGFVTGSELQREALSVPIRHGEARVRHVLEFAAINSGSPGESVSRVTMGRLRLPPPVLQQEFPREAGGHWYVDFWWPEFGIAGEFDGKGKYLDARFRGGRGAEQVVYDEKLREDELRRQCRGFARWGWPEAVSPAKLGARLRAAGLPISHLQSD